MCLLGKEMKDNNTADDTVCLLAWLDRSLHVSEDVMDDRAGDILAGPRPPPHSPPPQVSPNADRSQGRASGGSCLLRSGPTWTPATQGHSEHQAVLSEL